VGIATEYPLVAPTAKHPVVMNLDEGRRPYLVGAMSMNQTPA
jgi:hypothetical protein